MRTLRVIRRFKRRRITKIRLGRARWQKLLLKDEVDNLIDMIRRARLEWDAQTASEILCLRRKFRRAEKKLHAIELRLAQL